MFAMTRTKRETKAIVSLFGFCFKLHRLSPLFVTLFQHSVGLISPVFKRSIAWFIALRGEWPHSVSSFRDL